VELQDSLARYQARLAELPREIERAKWNIVSLSGELGQFERHIRANQSLARAQQSVRKSIRLVRPDDPYDRMQTAWRELFDKADALSDALRILRNLLAEKKRTQHVIASTEAFYREIFGETSSEQEGA